MTQNLQNHRSRASRMSNFFSANSSLIAPFIDITNGIAQFNDLLPTFDEVAQRQQTTITGYAAEKKAALDAAADIVSTWGIRCHVKAADSGLLNLAELLNRTERDITGEEDVVGLSLMKDIRDGLNNNMTLFSEQGLLPAIITEIDGKISAYQTLMNKPKEAISERKMDTEVLETLMKTINDDLKAIVSLLEVAWKNSQPDLIVEMLNKYRIDDLGHRYTGIEGIVNPIPGVINLSNYKVVCVNNLGKKYESLTNMIGEYKIQSMRAGFYEITLKNPQGVVMKTEVVRIERGVTLDFDWTV